MQLLRVTVSTPKVPPVIPSGQVTLVPATAFSGTDSTRPATANKAPFAVNVQMPQRGVLKSTVCFGMDPDKRAHQAAEWLRKKIETIHCRYEATPAKALSLFLKLSRQISPKIPERHSSRAYLKAVTGLCEGQWGYSLSGTDRREHLKSARKTIREAIQDFRRLDPPRCTLSEGMAYGYCYRWLASDRKKPEERVALEKQAEQVFRKIRNEPLALFERADTCQTIAGIYQTQSEAEVYATQNELQLAQRYLGRARNCLERIRRIDTAHEAMPGEVCYKLAQVHLDLGDIARENSFDPDPGKAQEHFESALEELHSIQEMDREHRGNIPAQAYYQLKEQVLVNQLDVMNITCNFLDPAKQTYERALRRLRRAMRRKGIPTLDDGEDGILV